MGAIAALVGIDETKSVAITEIAYKKLMGMKKKNINQVATPLLITLVLLLKSISLPNTEIASKRLAIKKQGANRIEPPALLSKIGIR